MEVHLPRPAIPPLWREGLMGIEAATLMRSPVWNGIGLPPGDGRPVLLIPGYLAGDGSLAVMTRWLRALGYRTRRAGMRVNVDCSAAVVRCVEDRLERLTDITGERVAIVGQSRGGIIARAVAVRRPDLVSGIVTLGSPVRGMLNIHPLVLASVGVVSSLGSLRVPRTGDPSVTMPLTRSGRRTATARARIPPRLWPTIETRSPAAPAICSSRSSRQVTTAAEQSTLTRIPARRVR